MPFGDIQTYIHKSTSPCCLDHNTLLGTLLLSALWNTASKCQVMVLSSKMQLATL